MKSQPVVDLSAILWGADLSESNSMELNQGHELCSKEKQFEAEKKNLETEKQTWTFTSSFKSSFNLFC